MQSLFLSREILSGHRRPPTLFNVVVMYEDVQTGRRAKKGLDYVAEELGNDLEFRRSMWRLDALQEPTLNAMAMPALAEADLLIISLRGDSQLPSKIRALIDKRLAQTTNHDCAVVALSEGVTPRPGVRCTLAWGSLRGSIISTFLSSSSARQKIARSLR